ncbi:MAG: hypothetical protein V3T86_08965 [Planctomycetota bacterium]
MHRPGAIVLLILLAGCSSTTAKYLQSKTGYRVTRGFVIHLENLQNPKRENLKDGVAYEVTTPGASLTMEFSRRRRQTFELRPGDIFVQSRPYSYYLQSPGR